ncbi:Hypothetical Protein SLY_0402 [Strawberry lethal yellows phytoplasma (CPA) str. NZSb11]|uniref:Uncharacterized protein n=1 Tax=Strawberry lethal yellows phytoplasma (CPA) str. NZSb11 TaxID=980422 RepID=R4RWS2_PHYAS|nr:Hypothetical Protein SLY_0402 [Strawberry lethal yellows phytoplasma (CPA) str. NZSb11]
MFKNPLFHDYICCHKSKKLKPDKKLFYLDLNNQK